MQNDPARRVATITANPAIDRILEVDGFVVGQPQKSSDSTRFPAGKGVNVSRAVASMGHPTVTIGIVGEHDFWFFQELESDLLTTRFLPTQGETRENFTIIDRQAKTTTHITSPGLNFNPTWLDHLLNFIRTEVERDDIVCLSGSLPPGAPANLYVDLIEECATKGPRVILDTSGDPLKQGVLAKPFMIKPNLRELEEMVGRRLSEESEILDAARAIADTGIETVVVSRGSDGVIVVNGRTMECHKAKVVVPSAQSFLGAVGCGDSLVAGFAVGLARDLDPIECIRLATASAAANLFTQCPGLFEQKTAADLAHGVLIEKL